MSVAGRPLTDDERRSQEFTSAGVALDLARNRAFENLSAAGLAREHAGPVVVICSQSPDKQSRSTLYYVDAPNGRGGTYRRQVARADALRAIVKAGQGVEPGPLRPQEEPPQRGTP